MVEKEKTEEKKNGLKRLNIKTILRCGHIETLNMIFNASKGNSNDQLSNMWKQKYLIPHNLCKFRHERVKIDEIDSSAIGH